MPQVTSKDPGSGRSPEEGMAAHSSVLAWRIPWTEEPGGLQSMGSRESDTTEATQHAHMQGPTVQHGNSTRYSVRTYMGKEHKEEWLYVYL